MTGSFQGRPKRQSIEPTYDHRETGNRFTVESSLNGRSLGTTSLRDPFVTHRVTVGLRDLLRSVLRRKLVVEMVVGGDPQVVDDVMELDADYLTFNSTRRDAFNAGLERSLGDWAAVEAEHDA